jgi:hypothetical protein
MNAAFREVIAADDDARRDRFLTTAGRLGTAVQNVERDFCLRDDFRNWLRLGLAARESE